MWEGPSRNYESASVIAQKQPLAYESSPQVTEPVDKRIRKRHSSGLRRIRDFKIEFGPSRKDILNFTNQLAVMVHAGISLQDSLQSIAQQCDNQKFGVIIRDLKNRIEAGSSFSQALAVAHRFEVLWFIRLS